jgi:dTDP-4-amino-4,6-dideoxygalactose transaminase
LCGSCGGIWTSASGETPTPSLHQREGPSAQVLELPPGGLIPALKAAKVGKVGIHVLRHSAAAFMMQAGASSKALQMALGHQSASFTLSVYGHVSEQDLDAVVERLEEILSPRTTDESHDAP